MQAKPKLHAVMRNRHTAFRTASLAGLKTYFRFRPPGYFFSPKHKMWLDAKKQAELEAVLGGKDPNEIDLTQLPGWDGWINTLRYGKVATGLFLDKRAELEKDYFVTVEDQRTSPKFEPIPDISSDPKWLGARDYQLDCIDAMQAASYTGGLVLSATGTGKTFTAGMYFKTLHNVGLFVVDELTLLEQTKKSFEEILGEKVGTVGKGKFEPERITVATVQTLHLHHDKPNFRKWFATVAVVIVDEIHVAINRRHIDVLDTIAPQAIFGLTGTLELQKPHVYFAAVAMAGPVIFRYGLQEGMKDGHLSKGVVVRVQVAQPYSPQPEWSQAYDDTVVRGKVRNACVAALAKEAVTQQRRAIVGVERIPHLRILSTLLDGVPHRSLSGVQSSDTRGDAVEEMQEGDVPLLLTSSIFRKGVDIPKLDTVINATAGRSGNNTKQWYGRATRTAEGKNGLVYIDIADKGNQFEVGSRWRLKALRELGVPIITMVWRGDAKEIFDRAKRELLKQLQQTMDFV